MLNVLMIPLGLWDCRLQLPRRAALPEKKASLLHTFCTVTPLTLTSFTQPVEIYELGIPTPSGVCGFTSPLHSCCCSWPFCLVVHFSQSLVSPGELLQLIHSLGLCLSHSVSLHLKPSPSMLPKDLCILVKHPKAATSMQMYKCTSSAVGQQVYRILRRETKCLKLTQNYSALLENVSRSISPNKQSHLFNTKVLVHFFFKRLWASSWSKPSQSATTLATQYYVIL